MPLKVDLWCVIIEVKIQFLLHANTQKKRENEFREWRRIAAVLRAKPNKEETKKKKSATNEFQECQNSTF